MNSYTKQELDIIKNKPIYIEIEKYIENNCYNVDFSPIYKTLDHIKNDGEHMSLVSYCCGSYYKGNYGGVAQFDYHLK